LTDVTTTMAAGDNPDDWIRRTGVESPASSIQGYPGSRYLVIVTATWPQGSVQFFFPILVEAAVTSPAPSAGSVVVPDVAGMSEADAHRALGGAGLAALSSYVRNGTAGVANVSSQQPVA